MSGTDIADNIELRNLYSDHHGWLRGWLHKRLGCGHRAADLTQDTFERILNRADISEVREPRPWLLTIAKRLLIDKSRRARLEQAYLEECIALAQQNPALAPSTDDICSAVQALEKISEALDQLSDKARQAFVLRHIDGYKLEEIAEQLKVSRTMVRKYLVQGLVACHQVIEATQP